MARIFRAQNDKNRNINFYKQKRYHFLSSFTEKSSEITEQKRTYSTQKGKPLYKVHIHSSTRGLVTNVSGLWPATSNDAAILLAELKKRKINFDLKKLIRS